MKTAVITGAASGIGLELLKRLLGEGWAVAAPVRRPLPDDPDLARAAAEGRLRIYPGDLADASSRGAVVAEIAAAEPRIDALFNNAGVSTGTLQFSPQGLELHYEVNTVAPYVLVDGLRANLAASGHGRVVNTVSNALFFDKKYDPETLAHPTRPFRVVSGPYASSKLALALWSVALAPALAAQGVTVVSVEPGPSDTPLVRGPGFPALMRPLALLIAKPPAHSAGLLLEASRSAHPSGTLLLKRKARTLPFLERAEHTLRVVAADAYGRMHD